MSTTSNSLLLGKTNGVCVNSIITDKIREYMMSDSPSPTTSPELNIKENTSSVIHERKKASATAAQDPVSTSDLALPSTLNVSVHNSGDPCPHKSDLVTASIRRIGNSLDALLNESKNASQVKAVKKVVPALSSHQQPQSGTDRLFLSSEQIRYKKSVTLHDICEEYIQFITVNSADEEVVTTTSENETPPDNRQRTAANATAVAAAIEPELQIIHVPLIPPTGSKDSAAAGPKFVGNRSSGPVAAIPKKRTAQISVITVNETLSKNKTARKRSIEDPPVATETECEKSNGATDQTTTECKLTLDKKEESVTTATTPPEAVVDENVISNGIKSTNASPAAAEAAKEEKKHDEEEEERAEEVEESLTKIESTASDATEEAAQHQTVGAQNDDVERSETLDSSPSQHEQSKTSPLRNGLVHEDGEKNGAVADEDADEGGDEGAAEMIVADQVAAVAAKKSDREGEQPLDESPLPAAAAAEETATNEESATPMDVDESAPAEPMETSSAVDEESAPLSKSVANDADNQTAKREVDGAAAAAASATAEVAGEEDSSASSRGEEECERNIQPEKSDQLSPSPPSNDNLSTSAAKESSTGETKSSAKKDATSSAAEARTLGEQDTASAPSSAKPKAKEDEVKKPITDTISPTPPVSDKTTCDNNSKSGDVSVVKTEEKVAEPTNTAEDKQIIVGQVPDAEVKEVRIKEEVITSECTPASDAAAALPSVESADIANATPASVSVPSSVPAPNNVTAAAVPASGSATTSATTVVTGTKRRADTASEDLEADRDGRISSSSSSGSDVENNQDHKRIRFDESIFEEDERERLIREFVERSTESSDEIGKNCDKLQHEIGALSDLARAKELEWNSIIRLLKLKEEMLERVLFKKRSLDCQTKNDSDSVSMSKLYKSIMNPAEQTKANRNESNLPACISNQVTVVPISSSSAAAGASGGPQSNAAAAAAAAANAHDAALGKSASFVASSALTDKLRAPHRPILPKPAPSAAAAAAAAAAAVAASAGASVTLQATTMTTSSATLPSQSAVATVQPTSHPLPLPAQTLPQTLLSANAAAAAAANSLLIDQNSVIGEGRQGPIVDVKSIIAEYRSKNPESGPRRGRRNIQFTPRTPDAIGGPRFLPNNALLSMASMALGSGSHVRANVSSTTHSGEHVRPGNIFLGQDGSISAAALNRPDLQIRAANALDSFMLSINAANAGNSSQSNAGNAAAAIASGGGGPAGVSIASASTSNAAVSVTGGGGGGGGSSGTGNSTSFQDALVKFAKMNEKRDMVASSNAHLGAQKNASHLLPPPPYPEVTLHPVLVPQFSNSPQNSLLHGILTKSSSGPNRGGGGGGAGGGGSGHGTGGNPNVGVNAGMIGAGGGGGAGDHHPSSSIGSMNSSSVGNLQHRPTNFSPTLARLLTAPERNRGSRANVSGSASRNTKSTLSEILNSKKTRTEVTITPVTTSASSLMKNGSDVVMVDDDDESESADRLVIDEGREAIADPTTNVIPADQVPECQGCHKKAAQFVCAGCGNQWYCSRECQVQAWEEHSEMCSG